MKLSILLIKKEDYGNGRFENVTTDHDPKQGETVEELAERLLVRKSVFDGDEAVYSDRIEIRIRREA